MKKKDRVLYNQYIEHLESELTKVISELKENTEHKLILKKEILKVKNDMENDIPYIGDLDPRGDQ